jgi:stearoyl-CoA desaturase (delta-9 desaturase)
MSWVFSSRSGSACEPCPGSSPSDDPEQIIGSRLAALTFMHLGCLGVLGTGWSWTALGLAVLLYAVRAFGLTAFYHRYFAHRAFRTSRVFQFVGALLGCLALQKGPLWWAGHHRKHHQSSDREEDVHSPTQHGFLWAHLGWFLSTRNNALRADLVRDWLRFPELCWLDQHGRLVAAMFAAGIYATGEILRLFAPALATTGPMLLVWCFFLSTVLLYHATYSVNSVAHLFGSRRYPTSDSSRNNLMVALLTMGEGWHNNHHHYPASARQGFFWWEIDLSYYALVVLEQMRIVWDLREVPKRVLAHGPQGSLPATEPSGDAQLADIGSPETRLS